MRAKILWLAAFGGTALVLGSGAQGVTPLPQAAPAIASYAGDPEFYADDLVVTRPESGTATAQIHVRLGSEIDQAVSVDYATADRDARAGRDYDATSGTLTFAPLEQEKTVDVTIYPGAPDLVEAFYLDLSNPSIGTLVHPRATITLAPTGFPPPPPPPPPPPCVVPHVVGRTLSTAKNKIHDARCRTGRITRKHTSRKKRNHVLAQSPRPGRRLAFGGRVKLTVGR